MIKLSVREGLKEIINYSFSQFPIKIGRAEGNDIVLIHASISRFHAEIFEEEDSFYIKDNNSKNGTYLNGVLTSKGELKNLDTINLGIFAIDTVIMDLDTNESEKNQNSTEESNNEDTKDGLEIESSLLKENDLNPTEQNSTIDKKDESDTNKYVQTAIIVESNPELPMSDLETIKFIIAEFPLITPEEMVVEFNKMQKEHITIHGMRKLLKKNNLQSTYQRFRHFIKS